MKTVQFKDVPVDTKFYVDEVELVKVKDTRISCCKVINATASNNPSDRRLYSPDKEVQVND